MTSLTIGNFDGVHVGHQALLAAARGASGGLGTVVAVTFEPHPSVVLRGSGPARLLTPADREQALRAAGATRVETIAPDPRMLGLEPDAFVSELRSRIPFDVIVEGADFRFGRGRAGDTATLEALGQRMGFRTVVVDEVLVPLCDGHLVPARSSTARWLLTLGRVADVARVLGRPHAVSGTVVRGAGRGKGIGYPTANISLPDVALPCDGVYGCTAADASGRRWRAAASIGTNPTFGDCARTLEVHVLGMDHATDLYGQSMRVEFDRWIRPMLAFPSVDALVAQMARDCAVAADAGASAAQLACSGDSR